MAVEVLTIALDGQDKVKGKDLIDGNKNDNQIVTFTDGGAVEEEDPIMIEFFGKDSPTEPGAGDGGDDYFYLTLNQFDDDFAFEVKSFDEGDTFAIRGWDTLNIVGDIYYYTYTGTDGQEHTFWIDPVSKNGTGTVQIVCFCRGTRIATPGGTRPVETLAPGDLVETLDNGAKPILWVGQQHQSWDAEPDAGKPIEISAHALGRDMPERDLRVSPQHRILVPDGASDALVAARHLTGLSGVRVMHGKREEDYFHLLLDRHEVLIAEGMPAESFYPGADSVAALCATDRKALAKTAVTLIEDNEAGRARPFMPGPKAQRRFQGARTVWSDHRGAQLLSGPRRAKAG
ncbi:MAG: Hint domain-containing protein [Rhodobacteraceae bacterium]|nr:Hint domain-containing protein [Paracoccaceae bacterium]